MTYYPHEVAVEPGLLQGQFLLTTREAILPRGWRVHQHGRWILAYNTPLECVPVRDVTGRTIGWVLGTAITADGRLLHPQAHPALLASPGVSFGSLMDGLCGSFLGVDLSCADPILHPDPTGTLASVFAPEESAVGSTGSVIPASPKTPFALDWILATDIPYADVMYPLGLTPRRGVERILPNHVLDAGNWRHQRRWPPGGWPRDASPSYATQQALDTIRVALRAVHDIWDLELSLTAGYDSRMLLACMRGLSRVTAYTVYLGDHVSWCDARAAREIASRVGIPHRVLRQGRTRSRDLRAWVTRTGGEGGEPRGWVASALLNQLPAGRAIISGGQADFARVQGFRKRFLEQSITPRDILGRCRAPLLPDFLRRAEEWLGMLPPLDFLGVGDLVHVEQRFGSWGGPIKYGELGRSPARFSPTNSRAMMETASRLPIEYRLAPGLHHDIIAAAWPELLEVPFNDLSVSRFRSRLFAIRRSTTNRLSGLRRSLRRLVGSQGPRRGKP